MRTALLASLLVFFLAVTVEAEPKKGTLKLRDGRVFKGLIEETPDKVTITLKFGTVSYPRSNVFIIEYDEATSNPKNGSTGPAPAPAGPRSSAIDRVGRFSLDAPEGWEVAPQSTHPALRAVMRPSDPNRPLYFYVSVEPLDGEFPLPGTLAARDFVRILGKRAVSQSEAIFESRANYKGFKPTDFFGTQVYRTEFSYRRGSQAFSGIEMRFALKGFEYILRGGCPTPDFKTAADEIRSLFNAFSFLPPVDADDNRYIDLDVGFEVSRPSKDWAMNFALFNRGQPVEMNHKSGAAKITVELLPSSRGPSTIISEIVRQLKAPGVEFKILDRKDGVRDGVPIIQRRFLGFLKGERKAKDLYYFITAREGTVLKISGFAPASGPDRAALAADLDRFFAKIHIYDQEAAQKTLDESKSSLQTFSAAVADLKRRKWGAATGKLSEILSKHPGFVRAYYLRAECHKNTNRWDEYRADLETLATLNPSDPEPGRLASESFYKEALAFKKQRNIEKAYPLMKRAFKADRKSKAVRKDFIDLLKQIYTKQKRVDVREAFKEVKSNERLLRNEKDFQDLLINAHADVANFYLKAKKFSRAKSAVRQGLKIKRDDRKLTALLKRIETEAARSR